MSLEEPRIVRLEKLSNVTTKIHSILIGIRDKIMSLDYVLVISILVLGIISMFAMFSTDGGEFKYHTNSHILDFLSSMECSLLYHLFQSDFGMKQVIYFMLEFLFITWC